MLAPASTLKLTWRRTWTDASRDFTCEGDPRANGPIGRIYHSASSPLAPPWRWHVFAHVIETRAMLSGAGDVATKDEAVRAVEAYWFAYVEKAGI